MARAVEEWVATHDDQAVPERVQLRVARRQMDADGFVRCALSGEPINPGDDKQLDHRVPLILLGGHRESNLQWVLTRHHRLKTSEEVAIRADNDARAKSHLGINTAERTGLEGRDKHQRHAAAARKTAAAGKLAMPARRSFYEDIAPSPRRSRMLAAPTVSGDRS